MLVAKTTEDNKVIALQDINYIRYREDGETFESCNRGDAIGVSIRGVRYSLDPKNPIPRPSYENEDGNIITPEAPVVHVYEDEALQTIVEVINKINDIESKIDKVEESVAQHVLTTEKRIAEMEQSLCELALKKET